MKTLHSYSIRFTGDSEIETQVRQFQAADPEHAFAKCIKKFPGCTLLGGRREGRLITEGGEICRLTYAPPSTIRIIAPPEPEEEQTVFGFFEKISLSPGNRIASRRRRSCKPNSSHIGELS
jgi:hypothetical protein